MKKIIFFAYILIISMAPIRVFSHETLSINQKTLSIEEVAPGIFVHQGKHLDVDEGYQGDISNIGFIIGKESVAVIDTGGTDSIGYALLNEIKKRTNLPIKYIINTHVHLDHIYGNVAFKRKGVEFIGHENLPKAMQFRKEFYERINLEYLNIPHDKTIQIPPNILVKVLEPIVIDLGDRLLKITAYPTAHTNTDITIEDTKTSTLWTGDLLFTERAPSVDGDIHGFIESINSLMKAKYNLLIPGHGSPTFEPNLSWNKIRNYLIILRNGIRLAIDEGLDLQMAIDTVAKEESSKWELFDVQNGRNINMIYPQMEWEEVE
jgi:quinoprotein relay system zinc metallohydrolase 2